MSLKRMTFGSLFAGIGGFDLGLVRAGMIPAYTCEIDPHCTAVLRHRFPSVPHFSDVKELTASALEQQEIKPPRLICGGFPCQGLSTAGKYAGLQDERSNLFFEAARIIEECRPRWVLIENVPGLLSSNGGRDMGAVLGTLGQLGYGYAYRVLDSRGFGVAQRRRRVFILARRGGDRDGPSQVLLEREGRSGHLGERQPTWPGAAASAPSRSTPDDLVGIYRKVHRACSKTDFETWTDTDISCTLNLMDHGDGRDPHVIVTAQGARRLMPVEQERLQGFPDGWTDVPTLKGAPMSDGSRYKQCGNAVTVPLVEWIGRRIMRLEGLPTPTPQASKV